MYYYVYKITFDEVPHIYYGVRKSKVKPETDSYMGTPVTHKDYWNKYTPKKTVLVVCDTHEEAWQIEYDIIKRFLTSKLCLNANAGGRIIGSSKSGKKLWKRLKENPGQYKEYVTKRGESRKRIIRVWDYIENIWICFNGVSELVSVLGVSRSSYYQARDIGAVLSRRYALTDQYEKSWVFAHPGTKALIKKGVLSELPPFSSPCLVG